MARLAVASVVMIVWTLTFFVSVIVIMSLFVSMFTSSEPTVMGSEDENTEYEEDMEIEDKKEEKTGDEEEEVIYDCAHCLKKGSLKSLGHHMMNQHWRYKVKCSQCPNRFEKEAGLKTHMSESHSTRARHFKQNMKRMEKGESLSKARPRK